MSNNAEGLNAKLTTQLRDSAYATWASVEMDDLIVMAVDSLWPRYSRPLEPTTSTITPLVADTYRYSLPTGCVAVSRVDLVDASSNEYGPLHSRAWELTGDVLAGTGKLHLSPTINNTYAGSTLHIHGYAKYGVTTNLIPNDFVALVLARARAEAYRRVGADRERFKAWLARNQNQNVSVNELLQLINEADNEIQRLERQTPRTWQKPVPATR